jgi:hypothetical protein
MALCGFRADNYRFDLLEGEGLARVLSLLERVESGFSREQAADPESLLLEHLRRSGYVFFRETGISLSPQGERLLETCRTLISRPHPPAGTSP